jgi:DNA-binding NtrC family response regulator
MESQPGARWSVAIERRRAMAAEARCPEHWSLDTPRVADVVALAKRVGAMPGVPVIVSGERGVGVGEVTRVIHEATPDEERGHLSCLAAHALGSGDIRRRDPEGTIVVTDVEHLRPVAQRWLTHLVTERADGERPVRVIATSQLGVEALLAHPRLDQELIHALDVIRLRIPALRERPEEILPLASRFLGHYATTVGKPLVGFSEGAKKRLVTHGYRANVSELRNTVERAVALERTEEIQEESIVFHDDLSPGLGLEPGVVATLGLLGDRARLPSLAVLEREYLIMLIRELGGRRTAISRAMGVSYPTVLKKIAHHRLDVRGIIATSQLASADDARS